MTNHNPQNIDTRQRSPAYKRYVLFTLTGVYAFNFIDRQILSILQEPIKAELLLSDTQLGMLTGLAFAALYVTLGIPIARYADNNNRKNVISLSLGFWSIMTAVTGFVQSFTQILLARIGVGIGEAGCTPPAHSIISDYYGPEKRATALSIYSMGVYIGVCLGFVIGGILAHHYGWRVALFSLGIPGVFYAILVYFTVDEPIRGALDQGMAAQKQLNTKAAYQLLRNNKTFMYLAFGTGFYAFGVFAGASWLPSFLIRTHGMDLQTLGITLGLLAAIGGGLGAYSGGYIVDKLRTKDIRWYLWLPALAAVLVIPFKLIIYFNGNLTLVLAVLAIYYFISASYLGPVAATVQSLFPAEMRSFASAVYLFLLNAIGMGLGPLAVGALSDYLEPTLGEDALRWAFTCTFISGVIAGWLFYKAATHYSQDLAKARINDG